MNDRREFADKLRPTSTLNQGNTKTNVVQAGRESLDIDFPSSAFEGQDQRKGRRLPQQLQEKARESGQTPSF